MFYYHNVKPIISSSFILLNWYFHTLRVTNWSEFNYDVKYHHSHMWMYWNEICTKYFRILLKLVKMQLSSLLMLLFVIEKGRSIYFHDYTHMKDESKIKTKSFHMLFLHAYFTFIFSCPTPFFLTFQVIKSTQYLISHLNLGHPFSHM